jgi:hypothetical protein
MSDFQEMSPAELRGFAKDHDVDVSLIDARKKVQLVALLTAWERDADLREMLESEDEDVRVRAVEGILKAAGIESEAKTPEPGSEPEPDSESEPETSDRSPAQAHRELGFQQPPPSVAGAQGTLTATVTDTVKATTSPRRRSTTPLTIEDLVHDDNRVRVQLNAFPMVYDGKDLVRVIIAEIPGEPDTLAVAWWKQTVRGPELQDGVKRVSSSVYDPDSGVTTLTTEDGGTHTYRRSTSCPTCGNRLSNWRPWKPPVRIVQVARR